LMRILPGKYPVSLHGSGSKNDFSWTPRKPKKMASL